ncbi:site-specific DNA-methyltransferase (adenine-specific) [Loktanella fryxellensis]|uniref:Methyltransferase n=1 Tax=Loktanella fryxellensis TaxID=245187 RepID=A0A1H8EQ03_9RHOB|nr:site-specific DNA-methyltransferase [Loktanella fryxellensis]SEN21575.1 site-specific DNA-methyltransferase (adenine-specific) [Loktanella fryxellensis]
MKHVPVDQSESLFQAARTTQVICEDDLLSVDWTAANFIINGDAADVLARSPKSAFNTVVTSPPYFGQRDYEVEGQVGSEMTPTLYIERLVTVFRHVREALRDDGTLWLNLGDKYRDGALIGMPWRVALALVDDGWTLRSDVIWHKPNAMPHSVKTRPTTDHEYLFMFSKSKDYYYDADAIREPHVTFSENSKMRGGRNHLGKRGSTPEAGKNGGNSNLHDARWDQAFHPLGRNKRTVWSVPLGKFREAHFAVFPVKLIEPCVLAGSPRGGLVLDPFFGSGTTGLVALNNSRRFVGIDLNRDYCEMAQRRLIT